MNKHLIRCLLLSLLFNITTAVSFAQNEEIVSPSAFGRTWQNLPVLPEISENSRTIMRMGIEAGHNAHAFSKVGDCDTSTTWYLADYDQGDRYFDLGEYESLRPVISYYTGSFGRTSLAATPGFSAASVLSSYWTNYEICTAGELPLTCEYRINDPLVVLISLGTNDGYNPPTFKDNMRLIIETTIEQKRLPVLMLKADNVETDYSINQDIADLADEYDIPVWNFWSAIQHLPDGGLQPDGVHLTFYSNFFSHPQAFETAWAYRNLTALQVLEKLQAETESILESM